MRMVQSTTTTTTTTKTMMTTTTTTITTKPVTTMSIVPGGPGRWKSVKEGNGETPNGIEQRIKARSMGKGMRMENDGWKIGGWTSKKSQILVVRAHRQR